MLPAAAYRAPACVCAAARSRQLYTTLVHSTRSVVTPTWMRLPLLSNGYDINYLYKSQQSALITLKDLEIHPN